MVIKHNKTLIEFPPFPPKHANPEIYRVLSLKQLRDPDEADGDGKSTIKAGNKIRSLPVDLSLDNDDDKRQCCNI
jgi:hypothetical protein